MFQSPIFGADAQSPPVSGGETRTGCFNPLFSGLTLKVDGEYLPTTEVCGFNPLFSGLTLKVPGDPVAPSTLDAFQSPIFGADAQRLKWYKPKAYFEQ